MALDASDALAVRQKVQFFLNAARTDRSPPPRIALALLQTGRCRGFRRLSGALTIWRILYGAAAVDEEFPRSLFLYLSILI
ncbi:hypothetical protein Fmac_010620 [Flemingia macrophylla]|uniref:Uncharacterized protein n=1 Tax=Flemingia macrophylla TaxID=520843 RepID=A0ABD1MK40_9FABA